MLEIDIIIALFKLCLYLIDLPCTIFVCVLKIKRNKESFKPYINALILEIFNIPKKILNFAYSYLINIIAYEFLYIIVEEANNPNSEIIPKIRTLLRFLRMENNRQINAMVREARTRIGKLR